MPRDYARAALDVCALLPSPLATFFGAGAAAQTAFCCLAIMGHYILTRPSIWSRWAVTISLLLDLSLVLLGGSLFLRGAFVLLFALVSLFAFPFMKLPHPTGPHAVGVLDTYLECHGSSPSSFVTVRIFYPCAKHSETSPYLPLGAMICDQFMEIAAPRFLASFGWLLHLWTLIRIPAKRNAPLLQVETEASGLWKVGVMSHGLYGNASLYSGLAMELASRGMVLLMLDHRDGSSPITLCPETGKFRKHNVNIQEALFTSNVDYVKARRTQTSIREAEILAASHALISLNSATPPHFPCSVSFEGLLDVPAQGTPKGWGKGCVALLGHSFGGASVLCAANKRTELFKTVIAMDPAVDWTCSRVRKHLFRGTSLAGSGGFGEAGQNKPLSGLAQLARAPVLLLYCQDWFEKNFGFAEHMISAVKAFRGDKDGVFGRKSEARVIENMNHSEFADNAMILPLWLCKALQYSRGDPIGKFNAVTKEVVEFLKKTEAL